MKIQNKTFLYENHKKHKPETCFFFSKFQVNNVDFANIIREEAVLFLLDLPKGEEVTILAQKKKDGKGSEKRTKNCLIS